jgi:hypothetical protein
MIKGQIAQEGEFNPMAWRYEPLNLTTGDFAFSRKPHDLRTVSPRSLFRLPTIGDITDPGNCTKKTGKGKKTHKGKKPPYNYMLHIDSRIPQANCPGLAIGADFSPQVMTDIANTKYKIIIPERDPKTGNILINPKTKEPITRDLKASDRYVSLHDIFPYNNSIYHWSKQGVPPSRLAGVEAGAVDFTAQLTLAASYGFLQVTYEKAIEDHWKGDTANCGPSNPLDPDNLFDTPCNLAHGGGSLGLGTHIVAQKFAGIFVAKSNNPRVANVTTFTRFFRLAYTQYDSGKKGYGSSVLFHARSFEPIPSVNIFSKGGQQ